VWLWYVHCISCQVSLPSWSFRCWWPWAGIFLLLITVLISWQPIMFLVVSLKGLIEWSYRTPFSYLFVCGS
jgi:hypothetical protein